jgi:ADP-heptose:LPS heptosyltransferase
VWLSDTDRAFAAAATRQLPGARWLALAPGANWPEKVWPVEHHSVLLLRTHFDAIIVLGGPGDTAATDTRGVRCATVGRS